MVSNSSPGGPQIGQVFGITLTVAFKYKSIHIDLKQLYRMKEMRKYDLLVTLEAYSLRPLGHPWTYCSSILQHSQESNDSSRPERVSEVWNGPMQLRREALKSAIVSLPLFSLPYEHLTLACKCNLQGDLQNTMYITIIFLIKWIKLLIIL